MTSYAVESKRQGMRSTGIVNEVKDWVDGPDGRRRPSETQARDEDTGMPLWEVEVLYRQVTFGRESNTTGVVRVGSPVQPVMGEFAPVAFQGLSVEVRVTKAGGLSESWRAEAVADTPSVNVPNPGSPAGSSGSGNGPSSGTSAASGGSAGSPGSGKAAA